MPTIPFADIEAQVGETHRTAEGLRVEAGKVAEFARAVRDPAPIYTDADAARNAGFDAIPAPPTFTRTAAFPRYRPDGIDADLGFDLGFEQANILHGEQRYRYDRPLVVGDELYGETTLEDAFQREGRRADLTFAVLRTDFYDADDERVQSAWNTRIETSGAPSESAETGDPLADPDHSTDPLERRDFVQYAGASGDFNPIHYDEPFATGAGHPSVFAQGMFTAGVASRVARERIGLRDLAGFRTRFAAQVFPDDTLHVALDATESENDEDYAVTVKTGEGRTVATGGVTTR